MEKISPETVVTTEIHNISDIKRKMHFTGKVLKTTLAGAVVDIGLDIPGVVHISQLHKEPVNRVDDVVQVGQEVDVWVRRVDIKKRRIDLTMIEPLSLEWRDIEKDLVVKGKVTRLEKFGAFVDIGAERPGLVHISEMAHDYIKSPSEVVKEGEEVEVKVLAVNRQKKQIKLSIKALQESPQKFEKTTLKEPEAKDSSEKEPKEEPVPTAMELALRAAYDEVKEHSGRSHVHPGRGKAKSKPQRDEIEAIIERPLRHKSRTSRETK